MKPHTTDPAHDTRIRLLEAAGEVFAEVGYRNATVRDICGKAGANVAAVNYYFGDKESLYRDVIHYAHLCMGKADFPPELLPDSHTPREERLRLYIRLFLARFFDSGRPSWHGRLMAREMVEPTPVLDEMVRDVMRPHYELLQTIVRAYLGLHADERRVRYACCSVLGQILFYHHSRPVLTRVIPGMAYDEATYEGLSEHIFSFTHAALLHSAAAAAATPSSAAAAPDGR